MEANLYCSQIMYQYPLLGLLDLPLGGLLEDLLLIAGPSSQMDVREGVDLL
jgi:hypothetical protein